MSGYMRNALVNVLVDEATALRLEHPTRVAVEGRSAAGKTTLAYAPAGVIRERGRPVLRASIDDFHRPGHKGRSQRGEWTARTYYEEGFDYTAFQELVLHPLGPDGSRRCRTTLSHAFHDTWHPEEWHTVDEHTVAIIDVGDNPECDVVGARNAGFHAIHVRRDDGKTRPFAPDLVRAAKIILSGGDRCHP